MTPAPGADAEAERARIANQFRPVRRRTQRLLMPSLRFSIEGRLLTSLDWSLGGLQAEPYAGQLRPGAEFSIGTIGPVDGPLMPVGIRARVTRIEGEALAAVFIELDVRAFDALEAMMLQRRQYLASLAATARAVA